MRAATWGGHPHRRCRRPFESLGSTAHRPARPGEQRPGSGRSHAPGHPAPLNASLIVDADATHDGPSGCSEGTTPLWSGSEHGGLLGLLGRRDPVGPRGRGQLRHARARGRRAARQAVRALWCGEGWIERIPACPAAGAKPLTWHDALRGGSSAGQSTGLIIPRSWVRAPPAPLQNACW